MKYLNRMAIKMLQDNNFIEDSERQEMAKDLDESLQKSLESKNKLVQKMNAFFHHPAGVFTSIFGYFLMRSKMDELDRRNAQDDMQAEFEAAYKQKMFENMLND